MHKRSILDLTHDAILVRGVNDVITYWNRGVEVLYGWRREQAVGKICHQLLRTGFPAPRQAIAAELLDAGRWEGELTHTKRAGTQVVVASRWSLQHDLGRPRSWTPTPTSPRGRRPSTSSGAPRSSRHD